MPTKWKFEDLIRVLPTCNNIYNVCIALGVAPVTSNYNIVRHYIAELGLDTSHFCRTPPRRKNPRGTGWVAAETAEECQRILNTGMRPSGTRLREKLLSLGVFKERRCSACENTSWLGKPISLELEHIDGDSTNNDFSNLTLLCPNCHSQTMTYRGRNVKGKRDKQIKMLQGIAADKEANYPLLEGKKYYCVDCSAPIAHKCKRCSACHFKQVGERVSANWPPVEEVITMIKETSFVEAGAKLGYSDNAVRKFLRRSGYSSKTLKKIDSSLSHSKYRE